MGICLVSICNSQQSWKKIYNYNKNNFNLIDEKRLDYRFKKMKKFNNLVKENNNKATIDQN